MVRLLDVDPDLGALLNDSRREQAERELVVRTHRLPVGPWDVSRLAGATADHVGLLIIDGILSRELIVADHVSAELLGPGDLVRPWQPSSRTGLLPVDAVWTVLSPLTVAVLDRRFAAEMTRFPEITASLFDRLSERSLRLATTQAISQLTRVDRRLKALFWHLAERWGRVARDGIAVPLVLSHRLIGELIGARRPTVSSALAELAREGQLARRDDGTWLLTGEPVAVPAAAAAETVRQRRRLVPTAVEPDPGPVTTPPERLVELRTSLEAARAVSQRNRQDLDLLQAATASLRERTVELRARRQQHVAELRAAADRRRQA